MYKQPRLKAMSIPKDCPFAAIKKFFIDLICESV